MFSATTLSKYAMQQSHELNIDSTPHFTRNYHAFYSIDINLNKKKKLFSCKEIKKFYSKEMQSLSSRLCYLVVKKGLEVKLPEGWGEWVRWGAGS